MPIHFDNERNNPYFERLSLEETDMPHIHEVAAWTSKGQITLPKSIRQALVRMRGSMMSTPCTPPAASPIPTLFFRKMLERGRPSDDWASPLTASQQDWP
jgi:hypothetical protein